MPSKERLKLNSMSNRHLITLLTKLHSPPNSLVYVIPGNVGSQPKAWPSENAPTPHCKYKARSANFPLPSPILLPRKLAIGKGALKRMGKAARIMISRNNRSNTAKHDVGLFCLDNKNNKKGNNKHKTETNNNKKKRKSNSQRKGSVLHLINRHLVHLRREAYQWETRGNSQKYADLPCHSPNPIQINRFVRRWSGVIALLTHLHCERFSTVELPRAPRKAQGFHEYPGA